MCCASKTLTATQQWLAITEAKYFGGVPGKRAGGEAWRWARWWSVHLPSSAHSVPTADVVPQHAVRANSRQVGGGCNVWCATSDVQCLKCLNKDWCIFWIGHDIFKGPPGTLKDNVDKVASQETSAVAFSPQKAATTLSQLPLKITPSWL